MQRVGPRRLRVGEGPQLLGDINKQDWLLWPELWLELLGEKKEGGGGSEQELIVSSLHKVQLVLTYKKQILSHYYCIMATCILKKQSRLI